MQDTSASIAAMAEKCRTLIEGHHEPGRIYSDRFCRSISSGCVPGSKRMPPTGQIRNCIAGSGLFNVR